MRTLTTLLAAVLVAASSHAIAQSRSNSPGDYPSKPVRWVITFPPGGPTDYFARTIGAKLTETLGQQFVIDSHAGASGRIGTELVAKSAPDGYTLLFGSGGALTVAPAFGGNLPYDSFTDFAPVSMLLTNAQLLVVNKSLPVNSVKDLIKLAKSRPGQLTFGSGGQGSTPHLAMELFNVQAGINMLHVPYKGTAPAMTDLLGGHVMMLLNTLAPGVIELVKSGKVKGLAVTSTKRAAAAPQFPTIAESGVPGYENVVWFGMLAPAKTPQNIVTRLNGAVRKILAEPQTAQRLISQGADPAAGTPEAFTEHMRAEYKRLDDLIKRTGIKAE